MRESVTYQAILEEGAAIGEARGEARGKISEAKRLLQLLGENAFGSLDRQSAKVLAEITDLQRLEELSVRLLETKSWQELLDLPAPRRRNKKKK